MNKWEEKTVDFAKKKYGHEMNKNAKITIKYKERNLSLGQMHVRGYL